MISALIVHGDRLPSEYSNGDIDILLKRPNRSNIPECILVLQQILYYYLNKDGGIKENVDRTWRCELNDTGIIESYEEKDFQGNTNFSPPTWSRSEPYTSINGLILTKFRARASTIQRW